MPVPVYSVYQSCLPKPEDVEETELVAESVLTNCPFDSETSADSLFPELLKHQRASIAQTR